MLCEAYSCLPSQLDGEDAGRLLVGQEVLALYYAFEKLKRGAKLSSAEKKAIGEVLEAELERG